MQLTFLGTGAGRPSKSRNVSSLAFSLTEPNNGYWLFDVGEATQHRLLELKLKLNKLDRIFITHMHGDHLYGLPGLLSSRTYYEGAGKLTLFGPAGIRAYVECVFAHSGAHLNYELDVVEIEAGPIHEDHRCRIVAAELDHRLPCFGYRIEEKPRPGALDLAKLIGMGVPLGPLYGKLKQGEDVTLEDGRTIRSSDVVGPEASGAVFAIMGDTRPCDNAIELARNADVLVHEATFATGLEDKAECYGHSTMLQAATIAARANAKRLVVTHFSSRYDDEQISELVEGAISTFPDIVAARDCMQLDISKPRE
ncbi:ribonuclease Z [Cohnella sp. GCM10027633]|uniref:ribonuclease Z n=1 Tax=unclassified Cohnella TaxID=2636738 RepID=UPI00362763C5